MKKLKIAMVYGAFCANGREYNILDLMNDPQGLTGSETSFFFFAQELKKIGHDVHIIIDSKGDGTIANYGNKIGSIKDYMDVVYIWNEPYYAQLFTSPLKILNMQINKFDFFKGGMQQYNNLINIFTSPSKHHMEYMQLKYPEIAHKWKVIHNCIYPDWFNLNEKKEDYTLMYASSCDRGLHLLLQCYPKIKKEVPGAKLKLFYNFDMWHDKVTKNAAKDNLTLENKNRADYIKYALNEMKDDFNIFHYQNVSKKQVYNEMSKTMVLSYPCSIINEYTEGFSCVVMEACAAGMVPVLSKQDALDSIYGKDAIMINSPIEKHLDEFTEKVILALTNKRLQDDTREKCINLSKQYYFYDEVIKLEQLMYGIISPLNN